MCDQDSSREIDEWVRARRAFTFQEIIESADPDNDHADLRAKLVAHPRLIRLRPTSDDPDVFVPDTVLFRWFASLNIRLARLEVFRLTPSQVGFTMSHLHANARWIMPPPDAVKFGARLGLIGSPAVGEDFVFPFARLLSRARTGALDAARAFLHEMADKALWRKPLRALAAGFVDRGFSSLPEPSRWIVQARAGLLGRKPTLQDMGRCLALTRGRVQQIESQFFADRSRDHAAWQPQCRLRPFLYALIADRMDQSGSLIIDISTSVAAGVLFLAKCCGVSVTPVADTGLTLLAARKAEVAPLESRKWAFPEGLDGKAVAADWERTCCHGLVGADVGVLVSRIVARRRQHLTKAQKVCLALRALGRPSHYSEVAREYARLWGGADESEHNIHAVLGRENLGVVWVGMKGTYALKEWGYEHPAQSIFETVAGIVKRKFEETGKPVPFLVIAAEIGRHRKLVNQKSLFIAASCNPAVRSLPGGVFVPAAGPATQEEATSADELDSILQAFVATPRSAGAFGDSTSDPGDGPLQLSRAGPPES